MQQNIIYAYLMHSKETQKLFNTFDIITSNPEMLDSLTLMQRCHFAMLIKNAQGTDYNKGTFETEIRNKLSPKHVPSKIFQISDIPKTKSGKIVELSIKNVINGNKLNNLNSIINPDCLKDYESIYKQLNNN